MTHTIDAIDQIVNLEYLKAAKDNDEAVTVVLSNGFAHANAEVLAVLFIEPGASSQEPEFTGWKTRLKVSGTAGRLPVTVTLKCSELAYVGPFTGDKLSSGGTAV